MNQPAVTKAEPGTAKPNPADIETLDAIITAAYRIISGRAGEKRDWTRFRSLFAPGARLIPMNRVPGVRLRGPETPEPLDVEGYIARVGEFFQEHGFFETEIARRTEQFDQIAHAFSTYESRHDADDPQPFMRGINSIQLFHDGSRWWILTIYWQQEFSDSPIPVKYLEG